MNNFSNKHANSSQKPETVNFTANGFNLEELFNSPSKNNKGGFFSRLIKKDIKNII